MKHIWSLLFFLILISCGAKVKTVTGQSMNQSLAKSCSPEKFDPQNITQLMAMIEKLPKPLELECLIKALKRPFSIHATSSKMSVQPALSEKDPRIFIFKGSLVMSFVTAGEGSLIFEFSEMKSDVRSIKGEIAIPVVSFFQPKDAFSRTITTDKTSCSGCHSSEFPEYILDGVQVYSSKALKPTASTKVTLQELQTEHYLCQAQNSTSRRCGIYSALLLEGQVTDRDFPAGTPTLLSGF